MKIAITETLEGITRKEAIALLETTGAVFTEKVTYDTNYLVASILNSNKAKRAREIGVTVITQSEFEDHIEAGEFPDNKTPSRPKSSFPEIPWKRLGPDGQFDALISYHDQYGEVTDRKITVVAKGERTSKSAYVREYWQAIDHTEGGQTRTFRKDRVLSVQKL